MALAPGELSPLDPIDYSIHPRTPHHRCDGPPPRLASGKPRGPRRPGPPCSHARGLPAPAFSETGILQCACYDARRRAGSRSATRTVPRTGRQRASPTSLCRRKRSAPTASRRRSPKLPTPLTQGPRPATRRRISLPGRTEQRRARRVRCCLRQITPQAHGSRPATRRRISLPGRTERRRARRARWTSTKHSRRGRCAPCSCLSTL